MTAQTAKLILNRAFTTPADGFYHVMPFGQYDGHLTDGTPIVEVLDRQAAKNIVDSIASARAVAGPNWPGILVDLEHRSVPADGDTSAAAWLPDVQERADGVYGPLKLTALGDPLVKGGQYRTLSPVFSMSKIGVAADGRPLMRPVALDSIGLTNRPNLKGMKPLSTLGLSVNAEGWFDEKCADGGNNPAAATQAEEARKRGQMNEIAKALGLPEAADAAAILAAIKKLQDGAAAAVTATNRLAEMEATALNAEADKFCTDHAVVIQNKETVKKQYIANKEATIALFGSIKAPTSAAAGQVLNRGDGKPPAQTDADQQKAKNRDEEVGKLIATNKMTHAQAWAHLATTRPELF